MQRNAASDEGDGFIAGRSAMNHLLLVCKTLARANAAAVLFSDGQKGRCIAHVGVGTAYSSVECPPESASFKRDEVQILTEVRDLSMARALRAIFGDDMRATFIRIPIWVEQGSVCSMLFRLGEAVSTPVKAELRLLRALARQMGADMRPMLQRLRLTESQVSVPEPMSDILATVERDAGMRTVLDKDLRLLSITSELAKHLGLRPAQLLGRSFEELRLPMQGPLSALFRQSLETTLSSPEVEVATSLSTLTRGYRLRATPIRPLDNESLLLDVSFSAMGGPSTEANAYPQGFAELSPVSKDATAEFLYSTLVPKRTIRSRGDVSYVTLRSWRRSIKEYQISALRSIKAGAQAGLARAAGIECANDVGKLVGNSTFKFVVPVPCGHSKPDECLSLALARVIGAELGLPVINAFAHLGQKGSSHPKTNVTRPRMLPVQRVPGPALLVDDVTTSGAHLAEAAALLKADGTETFSIAWIGGESP